VSVADIDDALYSAFGQRQISTLFTQASQYRVVLEMDPQLASGPQAVEKLYVASRAGPPVPLTAVARGASGPRPCWSTTSTSSRWRRYRSTWAPAPRSARR
jgi:multidrug efflux pump